MGLSFDDLSGFVQRLSGVAQRHHIQPMHLRERLLHELEELDEELSLEVLVSRERYELTRAEQAVRKAQEERAALEAAIRRGHQQQDRLRAVMTEDRKTARKEIKTIEQTARGVLDAPEKYAFETVCLAADFIAEHQQLDFQPLLYEEENLGI